jgi:hypothetical protein
VWVVAAVVLSVCGSPGCVIMVGLLATMACFTVLDPD